MTLRIRMGAVAVLLGVMVVARGQEKAPAVEAAPKAVADKPAAIVNGKVIPESAVERALRPLPPDQRAKARPDILNFLVDNALVDRYLELLKVTVETADVDTQLGEFKKQVKGAGQEYEKVLAKMSLTEAELKSEIHNQLRWDKFVAQQATDDKLQKLFEASPEIFDGSTVKARHILIAADGAKDAREAALKKLKEIKADVEKKIAEGIAKLPEQTDNIAKEKARQKVVEDAFGSAAKDHSTCPSKRDGGDLGEFPRMGSMVEPFAAAAFALKTHEVSDPVATQFGYHLILVTARKKGEPIKFETVKAAVADVYGSKLRGAVVEKMRGDANTKIEMK